MNFSRPMVVAISLLGLLSYGVPGLAGDSCDNPCGDAYLSVGDATGKVGDEVVVEVTGFTGCCIRGFSLGIGHDTSKLRFVSGEAGPFLVDQAGNDLQFFARGNEDEGYVEIFAFLDISFPITVPATVVPDNTVLAVLRYEVLPDAAFGETTLENRSRTFGSPNPVSNVYSRRPGEPPLDPSLPDGTVTIIERDTLPPQLQCSVNLAIECTASIGTVVHYFVSATDNVDPEPVVECVPPSGTRFALGVHTVRCRATDDYGNSSECEFTVTVADTTAPEMTCPGDLLVECNSNGGSTQVAFDLPVATDDCDGAVAVVSDPAPGSVFNLGSTTVTCIATDDSGNTATCTFVVTVVDETAPVVECPADVGVECSLAEGSIVDYPALIVSGECSGDIDIVYTPSSGTLFPVGTTTVSATATDASGNSSSCTFDVTVVADTITPEMTCPEDLVVECNSIGESIQVEFDLPTATDDCDDAVSVVCDPASGSNFPLGTTTVTCTATDNNGNLSTCSFEVTVVDSVSALLDCPDDVVVQCTSDDGTMVVEYPLPTANDDCDADADIQIICIPVSGSVFSMGDTTVVCQGTDSAGNRSSCTFTVSVVDERAPVLACPENIAAECVPNAGMVVEFPLPEITNECLGDPVVVCEPASGSLFPIGTTTVICRATDDAGNTGMCTFEVTLVADTVTPVMSCPPSIVVECDGELGASATRVDFALPAVAIDDCDGSVEVFCDPVSGSLFPVGSTTVICMARDAAGNTANCIFTVEVVDETPPVIECIDDIVVQCTSLDGAVVNYSPPQVATECAGDAVVVCDPPPGTLFAPGTTTVRCRATDLAGNSDSCTFEVTVLCADELRGDSNSDGEINISDVIFTLSYLYRGGSVPPCIAATDSNGNGRLNVIDVMFILSYLYRGGPAPPDLLTCDL